MRIVIAGGHGKIALLLSARLAQAGRTPVGLIRASSQAADLANVGAESVVIDLEETTVEELAAVLEGADAVVFAAGAGAGSTARRKLTVDRDGAILLADAAQTAGVRRMIVISAIAADEFDATSDDVFQIYLRAKSEADAHVRASALDWTIVRPGSLTDDDPTGLIDVGETVERGSISRADVAAVVHELLDGQLAVHRQVEVVGGSTTVREALAGL
jgi:uncharacterized protein YbjT (DUF2867 family)